MWSLQDCLDLFTNEEILDGDEKTRKCRSHSDDINSENKEVLLRERKRHTARRVASAHYVGGGGGGGGYPHPVMVGGEVYPIQS